VSLLEHLPTYTPGSEAWTEQRRHRVGGSEVAAILGLSPWQSRFSLWHQKAATVQAVDTDNDSMEWGRRLEAAIADKFADNHPEYTIGATATYARGIQLATPDRLIYNPALGGILEVKTARYGDEWGRAGSDDIPVYYRTQVMWYMDTLALRYAHVAVLIGGCDYREYRIDYDSVDAACLRDAANGFMDSITRREQPDIDGHTATYSTIRQLHPLIDDRDAEIPTPVALRYCHAKHALSAAEDAAQHATSALAQHMGDARRATHNGTTLATRQARNGGTPYLVAARNLPSIGEEAA
jgi:putative phage-type endonuclease